MVMKGGDIIESGQGDAIFADPQTDYTRALFAAAFGGNA
jgi:microcin C transport system ATP-binding protein